MTSERDLVAWARLVGAMLLERNGVPKAAVHAIVDEALEACRIFQSANPCPLIARWIGTKGKLHLALRGIRPAADPENVVPDLLDVARRQAAFDLLAGNSRKALQILFAGEKASYRRIAKELGVTPDHAQELVERALDRLRWWIAQTWPRR